MCRGQDDAGLSHAGCCLDVGPASGPTVAIAPSLASGVVPASIWKAAHYFAMRAAAALANATGAFEPHMLAELRPVDRVEPAHLSLDRHSRPRLPHRSVCRAGDRRLLARSPGATHEIFVGRSGLITDDLLLG